MIAVKAVIIEWQARARKVKRYAYLCVHARALQVERCVNSRSARQRSIVKRPRVISIECVWMNEWMDGGKALVVWKRQRNFGRFVVCAIAGKHAHGKRETVHSFEIISQVLVALAHTHTHTHAHACIEKFCR